MKRLAIIFAIPVFLLTTSCNSMKNLNPLDLLTGNNWVLNRLMGDVLDVTKYTQGLPSLNFLKDGGLSGYTGCNNFNGKFNLEGTKLTLDPGAMTKKYCQEVNENGIIEALNQVKSFKVDKDKLILTDGLNELMRFVPKKW